MGIKFNHKAEILAFKRWLPKYLIKKIAAKKIAWNTDFAKSDFGNVFIHGEGNDEELILPVCLYVESKTMQIVFTENLAGGLTIEVNGKIIAMIKPNDGISKDSLDALTLAISKEFEKED